METRGILIESVQVTDSTFDAPHPNPEHVRGVIYDPRTRTVEVFTPWGPKIARIGDWILTNTWGEQFVRQEWPGDTGDAT